jgi:hypothetical protein
LRHDSQDACKQQTCLYAVPTWTEHSFVFVEKTDSRRIRRSCSRAARSALGTPSYLYKSGSRAVTLQARLASVYAPLQFNVSGCVYATNRACHPTHRISLLTHTFAIDQRDQFFITGVLIHYIYF